MKKFYSLYVLVAIFFAACSPPQVTVTLPPAPTPTPHPKFAALQQTIAASGTRYTLNGADGLIYDGETPIPGVTVAPDGTMSLTVNGETVTLDPADVDLDDEKGLSIKGYEFQDTDGDGMPDSWVEVNETVTANFDLGLVLSPGPANEDGSRNIETFAPPEEFAKNEDAVDKWLKYRDAERLGFDPGATQWILTEDNEAVLVDSQNHDIRIARWGYIDWLKKAGIIWNWANFVEADGENVLFDVCKIWQLKNRGGAPVDKDGVLDFIKSLNRVEFPRVANGTDLMYGDNSPINILSRDGSVQSSDGKSMVIYRQLRHTESEGLLLSRTDSTDPAQPGESIVIAVENMEWDFYAK